jgi:hypothetical protein
VDGLEIRFVEFASVILGLDSRASLFLVAGERDLAVGKRFKNWLFLQIQAAAVGAGGDLGVEVAGGRRESGSSSRSLKSTEFCVGTNFGGQDRWEVAWVEG